MIDRLPAKWRKFVVGVSGGSVVVAGIVMLPLPGPGWPIIFAGLAILAKDFPWAARVLDYGKARYDTCNRWMKRQHKVVQILIVPVVVVGAAAIVWLFNGYGLINTWFSLDYDWLESPFVR